MPPSQSAQRARRLQRLRRLGAARTAERGVVPSELNAVVRKVLAKKPARQS